MRKINLFAIFFLITLYTAAFSILRAETPADLDKKFEEGNEFYRNGDYKSALSIYQEMQKSHPLNPAILYNMGNVYAKTGEKGEAILMWEKAKRIIPRDTDLNENIKTLSPAVNNYEMFLLFKPFAAIKNHFSINEWCILLSVFWFAVALSFSLKLISRNPRLTGIFKSLFWMFSILLIISAGFWGVSFYENVFQTELVLIENGIMARSGPGEDFAQSIQQPLPEGTKLIQVQEGDNKWVRVRLLDGSAGGWIPQNTTAKI